MVLLEYDLSTPCHYNTGVQRLLYSEWVPLPCNFTYSFLIAQKLKYSSMIAYMSARGFAEFAIAWCSHTRVFQT